jgi:magnesium chelatase subunit H
MSQRLAGRRRIMGHMGRMWTGRNIHALDPYRMPGQAALDRGAKVAQAIIDQHLAANGGVFPETLAVRVGTSPSCAGFHLHCVFPILI